MLYYYYYYNLYNYIIKFISNKNNKKRITNNKLK